MLESNSTPDISILEIENAYIIEDTRNIIPKVYQVNKNNVIINDLMKFLDGIIDG